MNTPPISFSEEPASIGMRYNGWSASHRLMPLFLILNSIGLIKKSDGFTLITLSVSCRGDWIRTRTTLPPKAGCAIGLRYAGWSDSHLSMPLFLILNSSCSAALLLSHATILTTFQGIPDLVLGVALELCLANRASTSPALPQ